MSPEHVYERRRLAPTTHDPRQRLSCLTVFVFTLPLKDLVYPSRSLTLSALGLTIRR